MAKPIQKLTVQLHPEENPHVYEDVINAYEKGRFYCILRTTGETVMYPIASIWRIVICYEGKDIPETTVKVMCCKCGKDVYVDKYKYSSSAMYVCSENCKGST